MPNPSRDPRQRKQGEPPRRSSKGLLFWLLIALIVFLAYNLSSDSFTNFKKVGLGPFIQDIESGHVTKVTVKADYWEAELRKPEEGESWRHGSNVRVIRYETPYKADS